MLRSAVVGVSILLQNVPMLVQAQEFTGVGRSVAREAIAAPHCGSSATSVVSASSSVVVVHAAHMGGACGRCVQMRWRWCSAASERCRWSDATETLRVAGQCAGCAVADLSFSPDVFQRVMVTRDAGEDDEPLEIKWQFSDCTARRLDFEASVNLTAPPPLPAPSPLLSPSLQNASASATVPLPPSVLPSSNSANSSTTAGEPSSIGNNSSTGTGSSSNSTGCSIPEAGDQSKNQLPCDDGDTPAVTTAPPPAPTPTPSTPPATSAPSRATTPTFTPASTDSNASKTPSGTVVVVSNSLATAKTAAASSTSSRSKKLGTSSSRQTGKTPVAASAAESAPENTDKASDKSTTLSSTTATATRASATEATSTRKPSPSASPSATPKKKVPKPTLHNDKGDKGDNDEEKYAPSASDSSANGSMKKHSSDSANDSSRIPTDPNTMPRGSRKNDALLKNPFFLSSVLLAVTGLAGAVVAYRAKSHKQHRHAHQNVALRQYSQRVQSASVRSTVGTPSPGAAAGMGDAYIVSSTTRHGAASSSSPVVAAAALSPALFSSATATRAQLGML